MQRFSRYHRTLLLTPLFFFFCLNSIQAQERDTVLRTSRGELAGTLLVPKSDKPLTVVLIIAGSGPTDRNGNNSGMENNSLKLLAQELGKASIASLRYDKRGVGQSDLGVNEEKELTIDLFANDVLMWIESLTKDKRFNRIVVAGHSEGSLLGMLAAQKNKKVSGFISIAGAGRPADVVIKEQLDKIPDNIKSIVFPLLDKVKKGDTIPNIPPVFYSILRPGVQPYMTSWFKYDPALEIKKLKIPVLIVQGLTDVQVKEKDARALAAASPKAELLLIQNMNHVLKECAETEKEAQKKYYEDPEYPLNETFVKSVIDFVQRTQKTR